MNAILPVLFRWIHVLSACLAIGGAVFIRFIVPVGLSKLPEEQRTAAFLAMRRVFKMLIHSAILLLLISGAYNTWANMGAYHSIAAQAHPLLGMHILLGLTIFAIAIYVLMGAVPPAGHRKWMAVNIGLMLLTLLIASGLKYVRDHRPIDNPSEMKTTALSELAVDGR